MASHHQGALKLKKERWTAHTHSIKNSASLRIPVYRPNPALILAAKVNLLRSCTPTYLDWLEPLPLPRFTSRLGKIRPSTRLVDRGLRAQHTGPA